MSGNMESEVGISSNSQLRVAMIIEKSRVNGPGWRTVVWVQGCTLACDGCWNQHMWPHSGGELWDVEELSKKLLSIDDVEGVTFSGGDPLQQPRALKPLLKLLRDGGRTIFLYTGYEEVELNQRQKECLELCDIAVVGRYLENQRSLDLKWRGSENQRIIFPTGKYSEEDIGEDIQEYEVHIGEDGGYTITGFPDLDEVRNMLGHPREDDSDIMNI